MPTYISLVHYTQQGIQNVKQSPARVDAFKKALQAAGATLKGFYLVMGQYDFVTIIEAPDDTTVAKITLAIGALGNIRTETHRAFTEDEFRKIIAQLP